MLSEEPKFKAGDQVVCISGDFPCVATTLQDKSELGSQAPLHPKVGEVLEVYENLGDFVCFDNYNEKDPEYLDGVMEFNWFHQSRFALKPFIPEVEERYRFHSRAGYPQPGRKIK